MIDAATLEDEAVDEPTLVRGLDVVAFAAISSASRELIESRGSERRRLARRGIGGSEEVVVTGHAELLCVARPDT